MFTEFISVSAITEVLHPLLVGATGGVAALILKNKRYPASAYVSAVIVSGFAGYLTLHLCLALEVNPNLTVVAVGIGGFFGPATLPALGKYVFKKLGLELPKDAPAAPGGDNCRTLVAKAARQENEDN